MADSLAELEMRRADLLAQIHNFPTSALARLPRPSLASFCREIGKLLIQR